MRSYMIANHIICGEKLPCSFNVFSCQTQEEPVCHIYESCENFSIQDNSSYIYEHNDFTVQQGENGYWRFISTSQQIVVQMLVSSDYKNIYYYLGQSEHITQQKELLTMFLRIGLECLFINNGMLSLHSACVEYDNTAISFSGKSGIGKSTRARIWVDELDSHWISGDRPTLYCKDGRWIACGVPWDGKEQVFRNVESNMKAILQVKRAPFNVIRKSSVRQAKSFLMKQCFIPMWDTTTTAKAISNINKLSCSNIVYQVFCGPNKADMIQIQNCLYYEKSYIRKETENMKLKEGFALKEIAGECLLLPKGQNVKNFNGAIVLNEVASFIVEKLENNISKDELLEYVLSEYDIDSECAKQDIDSLIRSLDDYNLIERED